MVTLYLPKTRKILKPRTKRLVLNRRVWEADGLVGFWPLGAYPDGRDLSLHGNHGDIISSPVHSGSGNRFGLDLDGSDDYVDVGDSASISLIDNFTISLWANWSGTGNGVMLGTKNTDYRQANGWLFYHSSINLIDFIGKGNSPNYYERVSKTLVTGWHFYTVVMSAGSVTIFYDATPQTPTKEYNQGALTDGSDNLWIGRRDAFIGTYSNSLLDNIRIYNRALSAQEVSSLHRTTAPGGYGRLLRPAPSVFRIPLDVTPAASTTLYLPRTRKTVKPRTKRLVLNRRVWEAEGLVGVWPLGAYPDGRDLSLYGNHGTINSSPIHSGSGNRFGLDLDGVDDYVDIGNSGLLSAGANFSISAWIYPHADEFSVIVGDASGGSNLNMWFYTYKYPRRSLGAYVGGTFKTSATNAITLNQWQHVAFVFTDGGSPDGEWFVNGVSFDSDTWADSLTDPLSELTLGVDPRDFVQYEFDGLLDDIRIYERPFSAQEVSSLYRTTAPGSYGRLLRPAPSVFRIPLAVGAAFAGRNQILGGGVI